MNVKEASIKWNISEKKARKLVDYAGYDYDKIPDDCPGIYKIDGRKIKSYEKSGLKEYIVTLDAIVSNCWIVFGKDGIAEEKIRTVVKKLKEKDMIILIDGKNDDSLNYKDYMVDPFKYSDWCSARSTQKIKLIFECIGITSGEVAGRILNNIAKVTP